LNITISCIISNTKRIYISMVVLCSAYKECSVVPPSSRYQVLFNQSPTPHFAGGFNQPIMCGGEPRAMLRKVRGKADPPFYTIQICVPKHGMVGTIFTILLLYGTFNSL
jgi:hypothetical protein